MNKPAHPPSWMAVLVRWVLIGLVQGYRYLLSPLIGPRCRYLPTCSEYAIEALKVHGVWRGGWLTLKRLGRCHPLAKLGGGSGYDPVPVARDRTAEKLNK